VRKLPSTGTKTVQLEYAKTFDLLGFSWLELYRVAGEIGLRTRRSSSTLPVTALPSLTMPAVARVFACAFSWNRAHHFGGAQTASIFGAALHLRHPTLLSPCFHQLGVAHQSSLRSPTTTMSFSISPFREAG